MRGTSSIEIRGAKKQPAVLVGMTFCLGLILYMNLVALGVLAPAIQRDLGIGPLSMGLVFSSFAWGYALCHIPAGWLGDRFSPRRVLTGMVLLWSIFSAATAAAWNLTSLLVARFLFGAAGSGTTPNTSISIALAVPRAEYARAEGFYFGGMNAGAMVAPPLATVLLVHFGWRLAFLAIGAVGVVWAAFWYASYPARPIGRPPQGQPVSIQWRRLLAQPGLWAILLMYCTYGYTGFIFFTWFPSYLIMSRHISPELAGILAAAPSALGLMTKPLGGWWSDYLALRNGIVFGRRGVGMFGFAVGAAAVLPGLLVANPLAGALLLGLASAGADLAHGVCFAVCLDVGLERAGTVSALMLTAGSLGSIVSALAFGALLHFTNSWQVPFLLAMAASVTGCLLWLKIHPDRRLVGG